MPAQERRRRSATRPPAACCLCPPTCPLHALHLPPRRCPLSSAGSRRRTACPRANRCRGSAPPRPPPWRPSSPRSGSTWWRASIGGCCIVPCCAFRLSGLLHDDSRGACAGCGGGSPLHKGPAAARASAAGRREVGKDFGSSPAGRVVLQAAFTQVGGAGARGAACRWRVGSCLASLPRGALQPHVPRTLAP